MGSLVSAFGRPINIIRFDKKNKLVTYVHADDTNRKKTEYTYELDWLVKANPNKLVLLDEALASVNDNLNLFS